MSEYTERMLMSTDILTNADSYIIYIEIEVKLRDKDYTDLTFHLLFHVTTALVFKIKSQCCENISTCFQ